MDIQNRDKPPTGIVALGGSAGGYAAVGAFFDHILPNSGLSFVFIDHRSPNSRYTIQYYLQTHTEMPVIQIVDGLKPQANRIYFLSGKKDAILVKGVFKTQNRPPSKLPSNIDIFFCSLAKSEGQNAIAVVLSGMLKDGTEGMKEIKKYNGTTIAQSPQSALYSEMPQSAIDAGTADFVFSPDQMASFVLQKFGRPDSNALVFQPREDNLINFFGNLEYLLKNLDRPILVLDIDLKITGFGGAIQGILPVIGADIGRRVTDLNLMLDYKSLESDVREVFHTSKMKEIEVTGPKGSPYLVRIGSGDYAPAQNPISIISFIPLKKVVNHAQEPEEFRHVTPFGIVMAHVDTKLRYTWVLNPHPDFVAADVIGKTDMELAQNDGISDLMALKKRVLESGMAEENIINFPLSTGLLSYLVSANAILNIHGQVIGVSTVGVEYSDRGHRKMIRQVSDSKTS